MTTTGLAFSGGGIRSAAFCSGVLRRLLENDVEVDYLSCVSGGGYTGTAYLDWKYREERRQRREGGAQRDWHNEFFDHMRDRTGYVCNWKRPFQGILDTIILSCLVIVATFVKPLFIWGSYACPVAFIIDLFFGKHLRYVMDCDAVVKASSRTNATLSEVETNRINCIARQGTSGIHTIALFSALFVSFITCYVLARLNCRYPIVSLLVRLIQYTLGACLAVAFIAFSIDDFSYVPLWLQIAIIPVCVIVWVVLPLLRSKISYFFIIFFYSFFTYLKVYGDKQLGTFSPQVFNRLLYASGFILWIVPMVAALNERLVHIYNRWRLQRAFYHPEGQGACGCSGIELQDVFPLCTCLTPANEAGKEDARPLERPLTLEDHHEGLGACGCSGIELQGLTPANEAGKEDARPLERPLTFEDHHEGRGACGCSGIELQDVFPLCTRLTPANEAGIEDARALERPLTLEDHHEGRGACGCSGIELQGLTPANEAGIEDARPLARPLTLADLKRMKPEYLANIVVNRWKISEASQDSFGLLTVSPRKIERIDRDPNKEQFEGRLEPGDLKLSEVMATSAAALSTHMGQYDTVKGLTRLYKILGLEMGATMISDVKSLKMESTCYRIFIPWFVHVLCGLPLILALATCISEAHSKHTRKEKRKGERTERREKKGLAYQMFYTVGQICSDIFLKIQSDTGGSSYTILSSIL